MSNSTVKQLLDSLLWDIYGRQQLVVESPIDYRHNSKLKRKKKSRNISKMARSFLGLSYDSNNILQKLSVRQLIDICAILKVELRLMGYILERVLIERDRHRRHQEVLCGFVDAMLQLECHDAHPKMRFSLSPPPTKAASATTSPTMQSQLKTSAKSDEEKTEMADDAASDYKQWLHAMKLVARLPGGMPPEFRRKLWLSLADKYLKSKNLDWSKEEEKCFCEKWREDDEELGIQIVKDLHRTGSNLCTGPAGTINQAKLKRILLGYARYNPEVGYCQGFNMLGALILQVMDKEESESMKVMIYLVEGVLPPGYFCGSMGGLQADMGVFRELMTSKLPRLAKHLQKLQGPIENAYEPPLTNVFTMQWFLTMFCTCLPMTCVLRVWDLVLIEGSDVLLRTALVLWSLLEERILSARTADDFYCKMGSFSSELLNGHLIDSNGLIEKVVQLGPIADIQRLRDKHLYNIAPLSHKPGLQLYYDDEEPESDEESRLAVATVWGLPWGRRGSAGQAASSKPVPLENKDRIALDISLLKKQYDRLRERQKQAHIILTTACTTAARQGSTSSIANPSLPVNNLLLGRSAIVTNRGKRIGAPTGSIPPARKPSLPAILQTSSRPQEKQLRRGETLHWRDTDLTKRRKDSLTWKEIKADRSLSRDNSENIQPCKLRTRIGKSDSSSYSEESDDTEGSSTDTSLCDEEDAATSSVKTAHGSSSKENSRKKRSKSSRKQKELTSKLRQSAEARESSSDRKRPKSWAPSNDEIPFVLMTSESPQHSGDEKQVQRQIYEEMTMKEDEDSATESDRLGYKFPDDLDWTGTKYSPIAGDLATSNIAPLHVQTDVLELPMITSLSQLSPLPDISQYLASSTISPMPTPKPLFLDSINSLGSGDGEEPNKFDVSDDGVTNEYFERVNSVERPNKLDLFYSLSEEDSVRNAYVSNDEDSIADSEKHKSELISNKSLDREEIEGCEAEQTVLEEEVEEAHSIKHKFQDQIRMELLDDYSEKSSVAFIAEATNEVSTSYTKQKEHDLSNHERLTRSFDAGCSDLFDIKNENRRNFQRKYSQSEASKKRRDQRRLTISQPYMVETADNYQRLSAHFKDEKSEKGDQNVKAGDVASSCLGDFSQKDKKTVIPSTADLEDRFNRLELEQLIEGKINTDTQSFKLSPEKSQAGENISKRNDIALKLEQHSIPSIDDVEERFSALEEKKQKPGSKIESEIVKDSNDKEEVERGTVKPEAFNDVDNDRKNVDNEEPKEIVLQTDKCVQDDKESSSSRFSPSHALSDTIKENKKILEDSQHNSMSLDSYQKTSSDLKHNGIKLKEDEKLQQSYQSLAIKTEFHENLTDFSYGKSLEKQIPSIEELENRFSALEKQLSSHSNSSKDYIDINKHSKESESEKHAKKPKNNNKTSPENVDAKGDTQTKPESSTKSDQPESDSNPRLSKIPSTAELEDRFNAMERKMSVSNKSPSKSKKEPPDDTKHNKETSDKDKGTDKDKETTRKEEEEEESKERKVTKDANANTKEKPETKDVKNEDKIPPISSKSPPTTEELDRRFEAIEKSLSSTNNTLNKNKTQVKEFLEDTQESAESTQKLQDKLKEVNKQMIQTKESKQELIEKQDHAINEDSEIVSITKEHEIKSFQDKSELINDTLGQDTEKVSKTFRSQIELSSKNAQVDLPNTSKRRASEPPTTEDLETRYEALKRRMSTKTFSETRNVSERKKTLMRSETVEEALERIEKEVIDEPTEVHQEEKIPNTEEENKQADKVSPESLTLIQTKEIVKRRASEPPTTEALEKRYEKLKRKMSSTVECSYEHGEVDANIEKKVQVQTTTDDDQSQDAPNETETERNSNVHVQPTIPSPPPMQANHKPPSIPPKALNHRRALVRELQSKMIPNDENLKPSDVNPNRKTSPSKHQHATMADETSEAHATTASIRLKNCEPWHMQPQKMVRRFSDLPSRSDLENRVHFLEEQLKLKYVKQRSASDSDVASRTHFVGLKDDSAHASSTSSAQAIRQESDLESRVKALEKQLSENSLKLIEAMRQKPKERDEHIVEAHVSTMGPKSDGVHPNIRTGMELVRYAHSELELENAESVKPINISINIKMHINKDSEEKRKHIASPKAEVLEKRLEALEQKVTKSQQAQFSTEKNIGEAEVHVQVKTPSTETSEKRENEPNAEIVRTQIMVEKPDSKDSTNSSAIQKSEPENDTEFQSKETKDKPKTTAATSQKQEIISNSKKDAPVSEPTKEKKSEPNAAESKVTNKESTHAEIVSVVTGEEKEETVEVTEEEKAKEPANTISENIERKNETSLKAPTVDQNEPNNKNMALPLDTEPRGNKIRRLTRANTEELEGLLQALEIQLSNRNLIKSEEGKLVRADSVPKTNAAPSTRSQEQSEALVDLSKEIQEFASNNKHDKADKTEKSEQTETSEKSEKTAKTESTQEAQQIQKSEKDEYDWGPDPVKRHLKRSTVYLPSTRELEARYRSLERQIKLLEDVEKIDVEQRLNEIERKIKLQYSLSHEKDLSKYLELCEGKLPDDEIPGTTTPSKSPKGSRPTTPHTSPGRVRIKTPHTSPTRIQEKTSYTSPSRSRDRSPYTSPSPSRSSKRTSYASPGCHKQGEERATTIDDLECRYRVLELEKYKPKEKRNGKSKKKSALKKQPIHPLEMLLDPSPDENDIPTTGELEHRIRVLDGKCQTPSPPRNSRNRSSSPTVEDIKREKLLDERRPKTPIHSLETMVTSPTKKDLPTEEELEARMRALEQDQKFDFKMQKNYKEFNQKLKDVISPSLSFEEFKATKSREQSPRRGVTKSVLKDHDIDYNHEEITCRSTSPKMIRFRDDEEEHKPRSLKDFHIDHHDHQDTVKMVGNCESVLTIIEENSKMLHHILKKTLADSNSSSINECGASAKGLDVHGPRLMRETSPLRRTGTHTGIPLRTDDNINDRLNSIKNTIKSIDTLCEEKPYHKEKCQRYIDSLFTESVYFASPSKKSSLEDLSYKRRSGEYAPSIRISDHSLRPSEYLSRSLGSAESIRSMSPSRGASPLHHRSTRELHRDISPRRHRFDEEHEEYESRITTNTNKTQVFKY